MVRNLPKQANRIGKKATLYKPEYVPLLIEKMSQGMIFEAFCAHVGVALETGKNWARKHKKFGEAKEIGEAKLILFMNQLAVAEATGGKILIKNEYRKPNVKALYNFARAVGLMRLTQIRIQNIKEENLKLIQNDANDPSGEPVIIEMVDNGRRGWETKSKKT